MAHIVPNLVRRELDAHSLALRHMAPEFVMLDLAEVENVPRSDMVRSDLDTMSFEDLANLGRGDPQALSDIRYHAGLPVGRGTSFAISQIFRRRTLPPATLTLLTCLAA